MIILENLKSSSNWLIFNREISVVLSDTTAWFNLESSVEQSKVCCWGRVWLGVIVQNGCSLLYDYNKAIRDHSGAIYSVAYSAKK